MSRLKNVIINEKYKIKHFIDSTSFCEVYSAQSLLDKSLVSLSIYNAAKISRDDLDSNGDLREINFLKTGNTGFPKLIGFGDFSHELEKFRYIATEFISGETVMDRMKRKGPLGEFEAVNVAIELSKIAQELHNKQKSILINGLSLDNIVFDMSSKSEQLKLRNLINLRYFEDEFKYSYVDGISPFLLADECFSDVFTVKTDQFNIAALLYNMIKGIPPFFHDKSSELNTKDSIDKFLGYRNEKGLLFNDSFDKHMKLFLLKALNNDPDQRFSSISEFNDYLNRDKLLNIVSSKPLKNKKIKMGNGFRDIAGMNNIKEQLQTQVIDVLTKVEHFKKYGVTIPNGMLLYGPPGCGKSYISEKFCEEAGFNFILIKPSDISSIYVSGGEEKIGQLFTDAENNSPSVICFDEVDAVMPKRTEGINQSVSARVNEFLAQINKCSDRGIFVIATTNKPDLIDDAMLRSGRLELQFYIPPPDDKAREELFKLYLKNRYCEIDINYLELSNITKNHVASDIEFIVNKAAHKSAMLDVRISNDILIEVLKSFKPTVSKSVIDEYEKDYSRFNEIDNEDEARPSIGFKRN
jgi:transitional endoplasmic reticulum ATPase